MNPNDLLALRQAASQNDFPMLERLLARGVDPFERLPDDQNIPLSQASGLADIAHKFHPTLFFITSEHCAFAAACAFGSDACVRAISRLGGLDQALMRGQLFAQRASSTLNFSPLAIAALKGCEASVRILIDAGSSLVAKDSTWACPLACAFLGGSQACRRLIFNAHRHRPVACGRGPFDSWLLAGASSDSLDALKEALSWASPREIEDHAWDIFLLALNHGRAAHVKFLLDQGLRPTPPHGLPSLLFYAAFNGDASSLKLLAPLHDIHAPCKDASFPWEHRRGMTILGAAASSSQDASEAISLLLSMGALPSQTDALGRTPLMTSLGLGSLGLPHPANFWALLPASPVDAQDINGVSASIVASCRPTILVAGGCLLADTPRLASSQDAAIALAEVADFSKQDSSGRCAKDYLLQTERVDAEGQAWSRPILAALALREARELAETAPAPPDAPLSPRSL